jgi:putative endonuclease
MKLLPAAKAAHIRLGNAGEKYAAKTLQAEHCIILARNFRCSAGEIDIVARDGETLVFVEVKTRRGHMRPGESPGDNLSTRQKKRIIRASRNYLGEIDDPSCPCRYDLIEVIAGRFGPKSIRHWRNCFSAASTYRYERPLIDY